MQINRNDYSATIVEHEDHTATLSWTDYVANDWTEIYPSLSIALMRLATLEQCRRTDWATFFALTPEAHAAESLAWLNNNTTSN